MASPMKIKHAKYIKLRIKTVSAYVNFFFFSEYFANKPKKPTTE